MASHTHTQSFSKRRFYLPLQLLWFKYSSKNIQDGCRIEMGRQALFVFWELLFVNILNHRNGTHPITISKQGWWWPMAWFAIFLIALRVSFGVLISFYDSDHKNVSHACEAVEAKEINFYKCFTTWMNDDGIQRDTMMDTNKFPR